MDFADEAAVIEAGAEFYAIFCNPLLSESAPRTLNVSSHTGGLFSQACDRWSVEMRLECCVVLIDLVEEQL